eukprot:scaffold442199_cov38-Prasinocladus_malaysianus.AAC.1
MIKGEMPKRFRWKLYAMRYIRRGCVCGERGRASPHGKGSVFRYLRRHGAICAVPGPPAVFHAPDLPPAAALPAQLHRR